MSYSKKEIDKSNETLNIILFLIKRLMKIKNKVYKLNRNCYGINRHIENMIHISREKLSQAFLWLDKSLHQLKNDIDQKINHNILIDNLLSKSE